MKLRVRVCAASVLGLVLAVPVTIAGQVPAGASAVPWNNGDVFAGVSNGTYNVYTNSGALKDSISDGSGRFTTGCAFNTAQDKLYTTNFDGGHVVVYDNAPPHGILQTITPPRGIPESVVFAANGHFFVGGPLNPVIDEYDASGALVFADIVAADTSGMSSGGADWIDLATDQKTMFYTGEGRVVKRYDVANHVQLGDFATLPGSGKAFALRLLPPGDGTGGMLVADQFNIKRLDGSGNVVQTYDAPGQDVWFALNLDPNGTSFWAGDSGTDQFFRFNIATGAVEVGPISASTGGHHLFGLCVKGELTAGLASTVLTETAAPSSGPAPLAVTFTYTEKNTGDVPINGVAVTGDVCGAATLQSGDTNSNGILDPGETWVLTCTHTFNTVGTFTDHATATGTVTVTSLPATPETASATVTVSKANPTISTTPSGSVRIGSNISDSATLANGAAPTGTITFSLYGPGDTGCTTPIATPMATVAGNGTYNSGPVVAATPGIYRWIASYGGDPNNNPVASLCGDETVNVRNPHTTLTRTPAVKPGTFTVTFTYTETNDGTDPISNVVLSDALCSPVSFVSGDTNSNGVLDPGETWTYTCTHTFIGPGPWVGTATATGTDTIDLLPAPVETATTPVTITCQHNITGTVPTALILGPGTWCIINADVAGAIVIDPGAAVFIGNSILHGAISANGATAFAMCGGTALAGSNNIRNSTGFVVIGDPTTPLDDGCAPNKIKGSLNLLNNHGGAEVIGNTIGGSLTVMGTTGTGPFPEDFTVEIEANTISASLVCGSNVPAPTNEGEPNTASSRPSAQCPAGF